MPRLYCSIRYELDAAQQAAFAQYADLWVALIEDHGGKHHGYFLSTSLSDPPDASFPALASDAPSNLALALFSFADEDAYHAYRVAVRADPRCPSAERIATESGCILGYERAFLTPLEPHWGHRNSGIDTAD